MALPIIFTPNPVLQGQQTRMQAGGFQPGETVYYSWPSIGYSQQLQADRQGQINNIITIDNNRTPGNYLIDLEGIDSKKSAQGTITVNAPAATTPTIGQGITPVEIIPSPPQQTHGQSSNPILAPIQNLINTAEQDIKSFFQSVISAIDWLGNVVNPIVQYIDTRLGQTESTISEDIQNIPSTIENTVVSVAESIKSDIQTEISSLSTAVEQTASSLAQQITTDLVDPTINIVTALPDEVKGVIATEVNSLSQTVNELESSVRQDIQNANNDIINQLNMVDSRVQQAWANLGSGMTSLYSEFNGFSQNVATGFDSFAKGLDNIASGLISELETMISQDTSGIISQISDTYNNSIKQFILLPSVSVAMTKSDTPQAELDRLLGQVATITGAIAGIFALLSMLENVHPFHSLKLSETFKSILEFVGVYDFSRETLKLFIDNGIGLSAEYALNNIFQARKIGYQQAITGLWYGNNDMDFVMQEAQYEGYEKSSRDVIKSIAYKPMPTFFLEKMAELQIVPNDFVLEQLQKSGLSPSDSTTVMQGFQNLMLSSYQSTARTLIYTMFKDGFIDETKAKQIMTAFSIPSTQQDWIIKLANQEYTYETQLLYSTQIIDAYEKGGITDPQEAITELSNLGMTTERAKQKITIAAIKDLPALSKTERQKFYSDLIELGVITTSG
ncbi:MAG: phage tail protein [Nitrosotalea sp.]